MKSNPSTIALILLVLAVAAYVGVIGPMSASLPKERAALSGEELRLATAEMAISQTTDMKVRVAALEKENAKLRTAWLTPMLNSYGMRAKSLLDAMATESGLANVQYGEGAFRALPLPGGRLPEMRTARQSVVVKASADYAAIVSFLMRAEKELPLMAMQSIAVKPSPSADSQEMELALEWPCEGRVVK